MKWREWFCFFVDEGQKLSKRFPEWIDLCPTGDPAVQFCELHWATEKPLAVAIREFAQTGEWPKLTRTEGAMLCVRLAFAADFAEALDFTTHQAQISPPQQSWVKAEWIYWFLLDSWDHVGFGQVHGTLESIRRTESHSASSSKTDNPPPSFSGN